MSAFPDKRNERNKDGINRSEGNKERTGRIKAKTDTIRRETRRGKSDKNACEKLKILIDNVRGYKSKIASIERITNEEKPVLMALTETKLMESDQVDIPGYKVERVDRDDEGGGVLIAYKLTMKSILVTTGEYKKHNCEILWAVINNYKIKIKIRVVYMPQESRTKKIILQ